jgi:hypothetical protein
MRKRWTLGETLEILEACDRLPHGTIGVYLKQKKCPHSLLVRWRREYGKDGAKLKGQLFKKAKA